MSMDEVQSGGESQQQPARRRRPIVLRFTDEESDEIRRMAEDAECSVERVLQILHDACGGAVRSGGLRANLIKERVRDLVARSGIPAERLLGAGAPPAGAVPPAPHPPSPQPALTPQIVGPNAAPPPGVTFPPYPTAGPPPVFE